MKPANPKRPKSKKKKTARQMRRFARMGKAMVARALSRQTKYYHRPMHINSVPTPFRVIKLDEERTLADMVAPLAIWPEEECYLLTHVRSFATNGFARPCDAVVCDRDWKVVAVHQLLAADSALSLGTALCNVWVFPPNATASLRIAVGSYVSTKERGVALER